MGKNKGNTKYYPDELGNLYCTECKEYKIPTDFTKDKSSATDRGRKYKCKKCCAKLYPTRYSEDSIISASLMHRRGITLSDYNKKGNDQEWMCAICGIFEEENVFGRRFAQDHSHKTNKNRGLLCYHCNIGLGNFMDDPKFLRAAADYIEDWLNI